MHISKSNFYFQELQFLNYEGYGPNFHRLQAYSKAFDSLITESTTFGYLLKTIKVWYFL